MYNLPKFDSEKAGKIGIKLTKVCVQKTMSNLHASLRNIQVDFLQHCPNSAHTLCYIKQAQCSNIPPFKAYILNSVGGEEMKTRESDVHTLTFSMSHASKDRGLVSTYLLPTNSSSSKLYRFSSGTVCGFPGSALISTDHVCNIPNHTLLTQRDVETKCTGQKFM